MLAAGVFAVWRHVSELSVYKSLLVIHAVNYTPPFTPLSFQNIS